MDIHDAFARADLSHDEVRRQAGGHPAANNDVVRQRLVALLEPSTADHDPAADVRPDDARSCGALVARLGGAASALVIADWMGWTVERTMAALAELDRRLDGCGLRLSADRGGHITVRERARLRARPRRLPYELAELLDEEESRHAMAHLVRGDRCPAGEGWIQALLDLGAALPSGYPSAYPSEVIAAAFIGVRRREHHLPRVVEISEDVDVVDRPPGQFGHGDHVATQPPSSGRPSTRRSGSEPP